jgi:hypothetical protein
MCSDLNCRRFLAVLLSVLAAWLGNPVPGSTETKQGDRYTIQGLRAHFYFQESGRFGTSDLLDPTRVLWNTPIGGGDAGEPSEVTLVLVEISGPAAKNESAAQLELIARTPSRSLGTQSIALSDLFRRSQALTVPFLIYGSGCEPVSLEARLSNLPGGDVKLAREIPFQCGE